jgi:dTMP kinase
MAGNRFFGGNRVVQSGPMFFSLDGIDGVGKSTQMELFAEHLKGAGYDVVTCRDPGSTPLGESIRGILLQDREIPVCGTGEMLLYMAARAQMVAEIIKPALAAGKTVISDRYLLANVVYQGWAGELAPDVIYRIGQVATDDLMPDLTLLLDLPTAEASGRLGDELDRMESRDNSYQQALRKGFLEEAARAPERIAVINAEGSVDQVAGRIRKAAERILRSRTE